MTFVYVIHPDWDELSRISHILSGRNFAIHKFDNEKSALDMLEKYPPDICLAAYDILNSDKARLKNTLNERVSECPIIALTDKTDISRSIGMVGNNDVYDYFLMHPIVDPARLHVIMDKALIHSAVQLNLKRLKQRLSVIPGDVSSSIYSESLTGEIGKVLDNFKEKMKSSEFKQIVKLIDEKAFDEKLEEFKSVDMNTAVEQLQDKAKDKLTKKLTDVTIDIEQQIDHTPSVEELSEIRAKLTSGFYFESNELIDQTTVPKQLNHNVDIIDQKNIVSGGANFDSIRVLYMQDTLNPTPELSHIMRENGYEILEVNSKRKFIHMAKEQTVDLIIIGFNTEESDGIEIIIETKNFLEMDTPCILLIADLTTEIVKRSKQAGFCKIIRLPFQRSSIMQILQETAKGRSISSMNK